MEYIPPTHKFVAVLNKKVEGGRLMNALAHMAAGISALYPNKEERTAQTSEAELEYWGVCLFGEIEQVSKLTKKFSLWR